MSLPPTTKDISAHPTKGSVTEPTNKVLKDADIERKIKLYGVVEAFRNGKLPSNTQIDDTLRYALDHSLVDLNDLSPEGRKLAQDTRDIIATARLMVQEKNADELFQNLVWNTRSVETANIKPGDMLTDENPVGSEKLNSDKDQAVKYLRTLLSLVLTNSEVRKLLADFSVIGRDILSKGVSEAANAIAPSKEELANVDQSAPNDQFVKEGGHTAGPHEAPIEGPSHAAAEPARMYPRDDEPQIRNPDGTIRPLKGVREEAFGGRDQALGEIPRQTQLGADLPAVWQDPSTTARPKQEEVATPQPIQEVPATLQPASQPKQEVPATLQPAAQPKQEVPAAPQPLQDPATTELTLEADPVSEKEPKKQGMMNLMRQIRDNVREGISDRIPDKQKDTAHTKLESSKRFFTEEYFPEERRDQFIFRAKKVIIECQKHDDYQEAIRWLLNILEEYAEHGRTLGGSGTGHLSDVTHDPTINLSITDLRTLLERFANNTSLNIIGDSINAIIEETKRDEGLRDWFKAVNVYIRKVLLEPGYVLEPDCNTQATHLRETGKHFYDEQYREQFDNLFSSVGTWFKAMGEDPINHQFGEDWARLTQDLLFDSEGSLKFKPELWNDIRKVILPKLIEEIGYIPIPRVEYSDDSLDLVVENLTLQGRNLFPNIVVLEANNYFKFSPYSAISDDHRTHIKLELHQMQADMRDVAFYYRKKTGISMKDSGIADVLLGGEGLNATIELVSSKKDRTSVFSVHKVHVKVDSLKFAVRDSKHDFLYKTLRPLATALIKRQIQKAIKDALTTGFEYIDGQLVAVRDRMDAAKVADTQSRVDVLKDIFSEKKEEVEASIKSGDSKKSHFKVIADKRHSLLANEGSPAGWANRTAEMEMVASAGNEWRSEAFKIV